MIRNLISKSLLLRSPLTPTLNGVQLTRFYGKEFRQFLNSNIKMSFHV